MREGEGTEEKGRRERMGHFMHFEARGIWSWDGRCISDDFGLGWVRERRMVVRCWVGIICTGYGRREGYEMSWRLGMI